MIGLRSKRIISDTIIYIVLTAMVVIWLFPLVWMIMRAFDTNTSNIVNSIIPKEFTMDNFKYLFGGDELYPYGKWLVNTLIVALGSCVISTLLVLMVSYALSRLRFKMRKKLMNIALLLGLFPGFLSIIALYYIFNQVKIVADDGTVLFQLTNNLLGLILVYSLGSGTGYYIVKGFFDTVPMAIDEAARIDGATKNRIFWQMIIPLSKPIIIYTILTSFIGPWCDFVLAKVFMSDAENFTVAVGIQQWLSAGDNNTIDHHFTHFCAGGVLIAVPIVILYIIMQKFYVAGITGGAAKG